MQINTESADKYYFDSNFPKCMPFGLFQKINLITPFPTLFDENKQSLLIFYDFRRTLSFFIEDSKIEDSGPDFSPKTRGL